MSREDMRGGGGGVIYILNIYAEYLGNSLELPGYGGVVS